MPHGHCFLWQHDIFWLHLLSDSAIALAYFAIPFTLLYIKRKRDDLPFEWVFVLFAAFILLCGTTHLLSIWVLWHPDYAIEGTVKALTALASIGTLIALIKMVPRILAIPSMRTLQIANQELRSEGAALVTRFTHREEVVNAALRASEERYALVVQTLSIGVWDWNTRTNELYWSPRFSELLGYKQGELKDHLSEWESRLHPRDHDRIMMLLDNHIKFKHPYDVEYRLKQRDGNYLWIHARGQGVWDEHGNAVRMVGSIEDITWRKTAEQQLIEEASRLAAVMNTVHDGIITIDAKGTIQSFNPAAVRIFDYQPKEVIGQNVKILMPEPYHSEHDGYLKHYLETGDAKIIGSGREVTAKRKDGTVFPMELSVSQMYVSGKRMFVGTIRDITLRKEADLAIKQHLSALKRSNQELDDFAYIASHDLKEPLRGLSNNARFLKEDYDELIDEGGKKRLDRLMFLCERMERLVNDLLYFSRLGRQELAVQPTNLNEVIHDIEAMLESNLQEGGAKLVIVEPLPTIICDLPRITEVYRNLISNAIKYCDKSEKRVEIGWEMQNAERVFYIRDNGIGIAPEFHQDVFRIFKRLNHENDNVKGTGVGLTFVKKIIERHRGRIWIVSQVGQGTTFYFTIPEPTETNAASPT